MNYILKSKKAFTKGEWYENFSIYKSTRDVRCNGKKICNVKTHIEDASLISAAPDMYYALLSAIPHVKSEKTKSVMLKALMKADGEKDYD